MNVVGKIFTANFSHGCTNRGDEGTFVRENKIMLLLMNKLMEQLWLIDGKLVRTDYYNMLNWVSRVK